MNNGHPNQGMRCIREIAESYEAYLEVDEFDVRQTHSLPDLDYDLYISSGGPGNPLEGDGVWEVGFSDLIDAVRNHNKSDHPRKKYFFFICHSFQLACHHFGLGDITRRKSTSFGVYPVHKTPAGKQDRLLKDLPDPYFVVDSRDWQLVQPRLSVFARYGAQILSLEKIRTHVEYERAIMAVRFSPWMIGTQFHPEADPVGMFRHFLNRNNRQKIIANFSRRKYKKMMLQLQDPDKIELTHNHILPTFIENAISNLTSVTFETTT